MFKRQESNEEYYQRMRACLMMRDFNVPPNTAVHFCPHFSSKRREEYLKMNPYRRTMWQTDAGQFLIKLFKENLEKPVEDRKLNTEQCAQLHAMLIEHFITKARGDLAVKGFNSYLAENNRMFRCFLNHIDRAPYIVTINDENKYAVRTIYHQKRYGYLQRVKDKSGKNILTFKKR